MKLAHIAADKREQTVLEHLKGTAEYATLFGNSFMSGDYAGYIGMMHDIGKYSDAFQKRLQGGPKVDHSTAGAYEALKQRMIEASFAIAGHHGGLPDGGSRTDSVGGTLWSRMNQANQGALENYDEWAEVFPIVPSVHQKQQRDIISAAFYIRMLYSCLVDADYLDTEAFMTGKKRRAAKGDFSVLADKLDKYTKPWFPPKNELNQSRCEILKYCRGQAKQKTGLYTLTVPTGGGKTIASMAFALHHAMENRMERVIYVIPYTSIIEQNAEIFRSILGEESVLEHHSSVEYASENDNETTIRMMQATENWDADIIVTTAVQFFESLFASKPSKCRKLHNIANSVIVFDEAQMIPLQYLKPCIYAVAQLVKGYGCTVVLCTATQPALGPLLREYLPDMSVTELCPDERFNDSVFQRVHFSNIGTQTIESIGNEMQERNQVLCIVNSRKKAREIYSQLPEEGSYHLTTFMYPQHRKKVLQIVRERLKAGETCRVVSTSLIEAGVDVDFPIVFREEAGLDSILQAAGRCNREGKRIWQDSAVNIFFWEEGAPPLFSAQAAAARNAMQNYDNYSSKEAITHYFRELYSLKGEDAQDIKGIMQLLRRGDFPFDTIAKRFHLIENDTKTIYIPIDEGKQLLDQIFAGYADRNTYRRLGQYGISVYEKHYRILYERGCIQIRDGLAVLEDLRAYDKNTGLSLEFDNGSALFI